MVKPFIIVISLFLALVAGLGLFKYTSIKKQMEQAYVPPPETVTTVVAKEENWAPPLTAVGSLVAVQGVTVSTDLSGIVSKIDFESGRPVKQGDLLIELDTTQEQAALRSAQARAELARLNRDRFASLLAKKAASTSDSDSAIAEFRQAQALVDEQLALISRKTIKAPFNGKAGIRKVNIGQYVNPGTELVELTAIDPVYVNFSLPQQFVSELSLGRTVKVFVDGVKAEPFEGSITAVNSIVDAATRNIEIQATIRNLEGKVLPGMFARVEVEMPQNQPIIAIPSTSISYAPYGDSVYVVENAEGNKTVRQQMVKLGRSRGDQVTVISGLKTGDEVVTSGAFKLRPQIAVVVNNTIQPGNDPNPRPEDR